MPPPAFSRRLAAEAFATSVLVFAGTGVVVFDRINGGNVTLVGIALVWGLTVAAMAYAVGPVSGAHMNPAVTVGLALARRFRWAEVPGYVLAQIGGAIVGSLLLAAVTRFAPDAGLGLTRPFRPDRGWECLALEVWLTGLLVYVVLGLGVEAKAVGGLVVGGVIALEVLLGGPVSGASMNPARSLAPAAVSGNFDFLWVYLVGPLAGAALAVPACRLTQRPGCCTAAEGCG